MNIRKALLASVAMLSSVTVAADQNHDGHILSEKNTKIPATYDVIHAKVTTQGTHLVFEQEVRGTAGVSSPEVTGKFPGSEVYSYVWPTSLNSGAVGFEEDQGILALALTVHPDFDDTPLYDEDNDGILTNDGGKWHSHWVVLTQDPECGPVGMKVKDIPEGTNPRMPITWPQVPIFIDSPGYDYSLKDSEVLVRVPLKDVGFPEAFNFDGVTSALRVNEQVHAPLLCISGVWDIASGDLSLPGEKR